MSVSREEVSVALFDKLLEAGIFLTSSRRFTSFDDVAAVQKPALYLVEHAETQTRNGRASPAVRILNYDVFIFISTGLDPNVVPMTELNSVMDSIDPQNAGVLKPDMVAQNRQTLGGLVYDCYIDGTVIKVPGDFDGNGMLIIPIKVIYHNAQ